MQVVVDNLLVNYSVSGKGKTLVLLHGWADSIKGLGTFISEISKSYKVIALDLPGFGGSEQPKNAFNLMDYANFVKSFLEKINESDVHILAGHSNGGAVSIKIATNNLIKIEKLVLIASSGIRNPKSARLKALKLLTKTGKLITYPLPSSYKNKMKSKLYKKIDSDYLVSPTMQATFNKVVSEDLQKDVSKISVDTLLLYADDDEQTPITYAEQFHQLLKSSTLEILHGGGHLLIHSNPKIIAERIKEFDK